MRRHRVGHGRVRVAQRGQPAAAGRLTGHGQPKPARAVPRLRGQRARRRLEQVVIHRRAGEPDRVGRHRGHRGRRTEDVNVPGARGGGAEAGRHGHRHRVAPRFGEYVADVRAGGVRRPPVAERPVVLADRPAGLAAVRAERAHGPGDRGPRPGHRRGRRGLLDGGWRADDDPLLARAPHRRGPGRQADPGVVLRADVGRAEEVAIDHVDAAVGVDRGHDADVVGVAVRGDRARWEEHDGIANGRGPAVRRHRLALVQAPVIERDRPGVERVQVRGDPGPLPHPLGEVRAPRLILVLHPEPLVIATPVGVRREPGDQRAVRVTVNPGEAGHRRRVTDPGLAERDARDALAQASRAAGWRRRGGQRPAGGRALRARGGRAVGRAGQAPVPVQHGGHTGSAAVAAGAHQVPAAAPPGEHAGGRAVLEPGR